MFKKYHPVPHLMTQYAGQNLNFLQTDSEEQFQKTIKDHPDKNYQVSYKINRNGFRCNEFRENTNIVFLGCSHTFGLASQEEKRWSSIVARNLHLEEFNLGVPGSSNDTMFRLAYNWIPQLKPKIVCFLSTYKHRVEIFSNELKDPQVFLPNHEYPHISDNLNNFYRTWISNENNAYHNQLKNLLAIEQICKNVGAKLFHIPAASISTVDYARDMMHFGNKTHNNIAHQFLSLM